MKKKITKGMTTNVNTTGMTMLLTWGFMVMVLVVFVPRIRLRWRLERKAQ